ncbi:MAG: hypothetical protein KDE46_15160 [Caldilineaceae bacterium]|nr:hypothetical protein [Caldilineaceae bacterium]
MPTDITRAAFHIGFYVAFVSGILLLVLERGSAEFAITIISFGIGLFFLAVVVIVVKWQQWRNRL